MGFFSLSPVRLEPGCVSFLLMFTTSFSTEVQRVLRASQVNRGSIGLRKSTNEVVTLRAAEKDFAFALPGRFQG